jgi:hypothetical protein
VVDNNTISFNVISGYQFPLFDGGSTNTHLFGNVIKP